MAMSTAQQQAGKFLLTHLRHTLARRPEKGKRVFARHEGKLVYAETEEELQLKIARRIQRAARTSTKH